MMPKIDCKVIPHDVDDYDFEDSTSITKHKLLMSSLVRFFKHDDNMNAFLDVIKGKTSVSLRLLDWLITNYSKMNNIVYTVELNNEQKMFNMFLNYKHQMSGLEKELVWNLRFDMLRPGSCVGFYLSGSYMY